jgi:hypothetical protein
MNTEQFDKIVEKRLESIKNTLLVKAKEYAKGDEDRLHNFNRASKVSGKRREECLWGMAMKHLISVMDIIDAMSKDESYIPSKELTSEKLGDLGNYLILLEACIEDSRNNQLLKK